MGDLVPITGKLEKLIPRLGTDADGEIVATVRAIGRALKSNGCDWHDLAAAIKVRPEPQPLYRRYEPPKPDLRRQPPTNELHQMALWLVFNAVDRISPNSRSFVATMAAELARRKPSAKQERYLRDLYEKNGGPSL